MKDISQEESREGITFTREKMVFMYAQSNELNQLHTSTTHPWEIVDLFF